MLTAPDVTEKCSVLNDAIPLFEVVASSPYIVPEDMSIPSPAEKCALTSLALGPV